MRARKLINRYGIWVLIIIFGSLLACLSVFKHLRFESDSFDLGIYDQMIWLASRFKPLSSSLLGVPFFGDHLTPSLLLLAPLYWLWDSVYMLLLFQSYFVAFGALPIYLLARKRTESESAALTVSFAYLSFFGIQNAIAFDFHPIVLATTLFAWLFYLYENKRFVLFWFIFVIFLGLQENSALTAVAYGIYLIARYKDFRHGLIISLVGLLWFVLAAFIIIPGVAHQPFTYSPTHLLTMDPLQVVKLFFTPVIKIQLMLAVFLAFGLLPFFSPAIYIILLEEYSTRFIGTLVPTRWSLGYQYNSILAAVAAIGAIDVISKISDKMKVTASLAMIIGVIIIQVFTNPSLNLLLHKNFFDLSSVSDVRNVISIIPTNASVAAANNIGPHLSHREQLILLTDCEINPNWWQLDMRRCFDIKPDYLIADLNSNNSNNNLYPDSSYDIIGSYLDKKISTGEFKLLKKQGTVYLLERNK